MTRLVSRTVFVLALLSAGSAAQAQSYTALGNIPVQATQATQSREPAAMPQAEYRGVDTTGSVGTALVHTRKPTRR